MSQINISYSKIPAFNKNGMCLKWKKEQYDGDIRDYLFLSVYYINMLESYIMKIKILSDTLFDKWTRPKSRFSNAS